MRTTARVQRQTPRGPKTLPTPPDHITRGLVRPGGHSEGPNTRSHPELGRENPQRPWYCLNQRRKSRSPPGPPNPQLSQHPRVRCGRERGLIVAGWSSPVARQAHNLKVVGSNPTPATTEVDPHFLRQLEGVSSRAQPVLCRECGAYLSLRQRSSVSENPLHSRPSGNSQGFLTKVRVNSAFVGSCTNSITHSPSGVWLVAVLTGPSGGS